LRTFHFTQDEFREAISMVKMLYQVVEKVISNRLFKKDRMQTAQNYEE
jgi:hypothetical protein